MQLLHNYAIFLETKNILFLVVLFGSKNVLMMVEVKGGNQNNFQKQVTKFIDQARKFQDHIILRHGSHLQDVLFYPVLAKTPGLITPVLCSEFKFNVPSINRDSQTLNMESIEDWWKENLSLSSETESLSAERFKEILKSLIFDTSLALMSIPSQLTRNSPDTLIILSR